MTDPILITGCSSGLGHAAAVALVARGHTVYATARDTATLADLAAQGAHVLALDVTSEDSMRAAVEHIEREHGRVGTLINNAGFSQPGPIETVNVDLARRQYETNVFGAMRLTQLVLPAMRAARQGRIINVSSMGGRMTLPAGGWYHSTKYALESLSDALRMEVRPFGISVVIIAPGLIATNFATTSGKNATNQRHSPYATLNAGAARAYAKAYGSAATSVERGARVYVKAVNARRPRHRYLTTALGRTAVVTRLVLGSRVWDLISGRVFGWR